MRSFLFGILTAFVLLPIGILGYFALGLTEVRSDLKPSMWESEIMTTAVRASVRRSAAGIPNAATATHETLVAGGQLYIAGCAGCHGELAKPFREDHDHFPTVPPRPANVRADLKVAATPLRPVFDLQHLCLSHTTVRCVLSHRGREGHAPRTNGRCRRLCGGALLVRRASPLSRTRARPLGRGRGPRDEACSASRRLAILRALVPCRSANVRCNNQVCRQRGHSRSAAGSHRAASAIGFPTACGPKYRWLLRTT
jgi:hypothetical protein